MQVTGVSIIQTAAAEDAGRPGLTPELLAAVGAKYSRSNIGLQAILEGIDRKSDPDKVVDAIFKFVDYGHQSIADMVPVAMFIDGISEILAYMIWAATPVQTAAGQESSTRYIKLSIDGIIPHQELGIPDTHAELWNVQNVQAFESYERALVLWEEMLDRDPSLAKIPQLLLQDTAKELQVKRMKRNFAFDRARVFLPVGVATNMFLLMSARSWVGLCQYLLSSPLKEANSLGALIASELTLFAPRLVKHAAGKASTAAGLMQEFEEMVALATPEMICWESEPTPYLDTMLPPGVTGEDLAKALSHHDNRYAWIGQQLRRTSVRFGWEAVGLAEIRDFNRHRTGSKYCPMVPVGFHAASSEWNNEEDSVAGEFARISEAGLISANNANIFLREGSPSYIYWMLLGTQLPFEHTTTGDKFLYEMELRTGTGAHYRYASHCRDVLRLWYEKYPETQGLILEGSAEPE